MVVAQVKAHSFLGSWFAPLLKVVFQRTEVWSVLALHSPGPMWLSSRWHEAEVPEPMWNESFQPSVESKELNKD